MAFDPFSYLTSQGWTPIQSAAILGNLTWESGLNPGAIGDNGSAYGAAQWHLNRQNQFAINNGYSIVGSSLEDQIKFVNWELNNTESSAGNALRGANNLSDATSIFMNKYERPANSSSFKNRLQAAQDIISKGSKALQDWLNGKNFSFAKGLNDATGGITDGLGITGNCNYLCQFQQWLANSHFWQRVAIVILSLIVIAAAFYLLGRKE